MNQRDTSSKIMIVQEMIHLLVMQRFKSITLHVYHQLIKTEYESLSIIMICLTQNIIENMIINEQNAKIQSLFKRDFNA